MHLQQRTHGSAKAIPESREVFLSFLYYPSTFASQGRCVRTASSSHSPMEVAEEMNLALPSSTGASCCQVLLPWNQDVGP